MTDRHTGHTDIIEEAFEGLDREALDELRNLAEMKVYSQGAVVVQEGDEADRMFVITRGRVIITQAVAEEEERVLAFRGPGAYFGEMALITDQPRSATVRTVIETEMLEVTKETFDRVLQTSPNLARSLLRTLVLNIREADRAAIKDLKRQHDELQEAYVNLRAAQEELVAKERLERELEIAGEVQRSLLPKSLPRVLGFEFAVRFEPARQVGGDFFDVMPLPDGQVGVLLADVSDKGAHAALFMAVTRTLFRTQARLQLDPVAVVQAVHEGLLDVSTSEMFVTALYGVLDPQSRLFRYVRAGHDEPLWVQADGTSTFLGGKGRFLGLWPTPPPVEEEQQLQFEPGDCLVIYSDGVTDMTNAKGEPFGAQRLERVIGGSHTRDAEGIAQAVVDAVHKHQGRADAFDDVTLLVTRVLEFSSGGTLLHKGKRK